MLSLSCYTRHIHTSKYCVFGIDFVDHNLLTQKTLPWHDVLSPLLLTLIASSCVESLIGVLIHKFIDYWRPFPIKYHPFSTHSRKPLLFWNKDIDILMHEMKIIWQRNKDSILVAFTLNYRIKKPIKEIPFHSLSNIRKNDFFSKSYD